MAASLDNAVFRMADSGGNVAATFGPLLNFEWVTAVDEAIPRLGVKGGLQGFRSPAKRTLDAWNREIRMADGWMQRGSASSHGNERGGWRIERASTMLAPVKSESSEHERKTV